MQGTESEIELKASWQDCKQFATKTWLIGHLIQYEQNITTIKTFISH